MNTRGGYKDRYNFWSLLGFALPNIIMMLMLSAYSIVDGIFVSHYVGTNGISAINIFQPVYNIIMAVAIMLGTGGSAIIARKLGEGDKQDAMEDFSMLTLVGAIVGVVIAVAGCLTAGPVFRALGAGDTLFPYCYPYGTIIYAFAPAFILQTMFQTFFVTAGKPGIGLMATVGAGVANVVLDYLFIVPFNMGIGGAALATGIGFCIPTVVGIVYFSVNKKSALRFTKPKFDKVVLSKSCSNGSSEMVSNLAVAITTFLFNMMFLKYYGEDGVAAISIAFYFQFVYSAVYFGYSGGVAPLISYNYGRDNRQQLKSIFRTSMIFLSVMGVLTYAVSMLTADKVIRWFAAEGSTVFNLTSEGFVFFSISFLLMGYNIFASSMFTAFSDGKISALLSFSRTFFFLVGCILILPLILGGQGIWMAVPAAEALGLVVSVICLWKKRKIYHYTRAFRGR